MQIPGSDQVTETTGNLDNSTTSETVGRWHKQFGEGVKPPMTVRRSEAIREKRRWESIQLDPSRCASAHELVKALAGGELRPFSFDHERVLELVCVEAREHRDVMQHGRKLSARHLRAISAVATVTFAWGRVGLIAPHLEMGQLLGLGATRTGEVMRELVDMGLLTSEPTFRRYWNPKAGVHGWSRAANLYALALPLYRALANGLARRGIAFRSSFSSGVEGNPEIPSCTSEKNSGSSGTGSQFRRPRAPEGAEAAPKAPQVDFRTAVPDAAPVPVQPVTRQAETSHPSGRLCEPRGVDAVLAAIGGDDPELAAILRARNAKFGGDS